MCRSVLFAYWCLQLHCLWSMSRCEPLLHPSIYLHAWLYCLLTWANCMPPFLHICPCVIRTTKKQLSFESEFQYKKWSNAFTEQTASKIDHWHLLYLHHWKNDWRNVANNAVMIIAHFGNFRISHQTWFRWKNYIPLQTPENKIMEEKST